MPVADGGGPEHNNNKNNHDKSRFRPSCFALFKVCCRSSYLMTFFQVVTYNRRGKQNLASNERVNLERNSLAPSIWAVLKTFQDGACGSVNLVILMCIMSKTWGTVPMCKPSVQTDPYIGQISAVAN